MARLLLNDEQWKRIGHLLARPRNANKGGRPAVDRRKVINGVFWILRTGAPWRDMPTKIVIPAKAGIGSWQTAWRLFDECNGDGTLARILRSLQSNHMHNAGQSHELWCIDGSVMRAARCAAGGGKKGIQKSRKITR